MTTRQAALACAGATLLFMLTLGQGETAAQGRKTKQEAAPGEDRVSALEKALAAMKANQDALLKRLKELEQKNKEQREEQQEQELEQLQKQADAEAAGGGEVVKQADEEGDLKSQDFRGGQRALQALNPEISLVADAYGLAIAREGGYASEEDRSGFYFRMIGLHFQADLDPFSFTKITVGITPDGVGLGEAYMTWTSVLPGLSLTVGKFRQEFGVVNRWHLPGLDQYDWPLAMREIFGGGGLGQVGFSLEWLMPKLWAHANHLVVQVTNGQNDRLFAGKLFSIPATLLRLKSYWDLNESTYFELGLTGMVGFNNARGKADASGELQDEDWRPTYVWGADWTLVWEPLQQAKYRNVTARGELYGARKELDGDKVIQALGLYQYVEGKVSRSWVLGARFDWTMPFVEDNEGKHILGVQPYITWWQSPWVRLRLAYSYTHSDQRPETEKHDHRVLLQGTFAAGPHKHERY